MDLKNYVLKSTFSISWRRLCPRYFSKSNKLYMESKKVNCGYSDYIWIIYGCRKIEKLQNDFNTQNVRLYVETTWLSCKILPESCKNCLSCKIKCKIKDEEKWLSCKTWQKNGYVAIFLQVSSGRAVLLLALFRAKHFISNRNLLKSQLLFFKEK